MRSIALIIGSLSLIPALRGADDACSLLPQSRVSEVLGVTVGPGQHAFETPNGRRTCSWSQPASGEKQLLLDLFGNIGRLTPVERFENAKKPVTGISENAGEWNRRRCFLDGFRGRHQPVREKRGVRDPD